MFGRKNPANHPLVQAFEAALRDGNHKFYPSDAGFELHQKADALAMTAVMQRIAGLDDAPLVLWAPLAASMLNQPIESNSTTLVKIILREGVPALLRIEERLRASSLDPGGEAWIRVLRALVITSSVEGGQRLLSAIAAVLHSSHHLWAFIFSDLRTSTIQREQLYEAYANNLPPAPFMPRFVSLGNAVCLKDSTARHPLDLPEAGSWFETWLRDPKTDEDTVIDAAVSLSFLKQPWAGRLHEAAFNHSIRQVRLEAAWGFARSGSGRGIDALVAECRDFRSTLRAQAYLQELDLDDRIPTICQEAEFTAKGELSRWLDQPDSGYNCPPDSIETVWRTEALWPGQKSPAGLFVLTYRIHDPWQILLPGRGFGVGIEGNPPRLIWCRELTSEGHPCYEDMAAAGIYMLFKDDRFKMVYWSDELEEYAFLISQWNGAPLAEAKLSIVIVVDPPLPNFPTLVGIVEAVLEGRTGWAVIESPAPPNAPPYWYAAELRESDTIHSDVLAGHLGRRLLGWPLRPEDYQGVRPAPVEPWPAKHLADRYEAMVDQAVLGSESQQYSLFQGVRARIPDFLGDYAKAVTELGEPTRFSQTARRLMPICTHDETACLLIPHLVSFGDREAALQVLQDMETRPSNPFFLEPTLQVEAFHALGRDEDSMRILQSALNYAIQLYREQAVSWGRDEKASYVKKYRTLVGLLEKCSGGNAARFLAEWNLPADMVCDART
jgi:hypothetical protein